jgi:hypothetical protein
MMGLPDGTRIYLAAGRTDLRRGIDGLAAQVQTVLCHDPFSGHLFLFRGVSLSGCFSFGAAPRTPSKFCCTMAAALC